MLNAILASNYYIYVASYVLALMLSLNLESQSLVKSLALSSIVIRRLAVSLILCDAKMI